MTTATWKDLSLRQRHLLRELEREESLQPRFGLTPKQVVWEGYQEMLRGYCQPGGPEINYMSIAYRPSRFAVSRLQRFRQDHPIVKLDQISAFIMNPIMLKHWRRPTRRDRHYRLNCLETVFQKYDDEVRVSSSEEPNTEKRLRLFQKNISLMPIQEHYRFSWEEYDPDVIVPESPALRAPLSGNFTIRKDALRVSLCVNGMPVYRFLLCDEPLVRLHSQRSRELPKSGTHVTAGDVLGCLNGKIGYAKLWNRKSSGEGSSFAPSTDRIVGDLFCATRPPAGKGVFDFEMALDMMREIAFASTGTAGGREPQPMGGLDGWGPRLLLKFEEEFLESALKGGAWSYTPLFRARMSRELSPGGSFYVRAQAAEDTHVAEYSTMDHTLTYDTGCVDPLPTSSVIFSRMREYGAKVERQAPIADWCRRVPMNWEEVEKALGSAFPWATKEFLLNEVAIHPGQYGYSGTHVLVDSSYIPLSLQHLSKEGGDYIDLRPLQPYLEEGGYYVPPPIKISNWKNVIEIPHKTSGIIYDATPKGSYYRKEAKQV